MWSIDNIQNEENEYTTSDIAVHREEKIIHTIMNIFPCVFVFIHVFLYCVHFGENRTPSKISFSNQ